VGEIAGLCPAPRQGNDSPAPPFVRPCWNLVSYGGARLGGGVLFCGSGVEGERGGIAGPCLLSRLGDESPHRSLVSRRVLTDAPRLRLRTFGAEKWATLCFC